MSETICKNPTDCAEGCSVIAMRALQVHAGAAAIERVRQGWTGSQADRVDLAAANAINMAGMQGGLKQMFDMADCPSLYTTGENWRAAPQCDRAALVIAATIAPYIGPVNPFQRVVIERLGLQSDLRPAEPGTHTPTPGVFVVDSDGTITG